VALETELWPNLLRTLEARGVPRAIVNGRLTDRSLARGGPWLARAASRLSLVAARDEASAQAFRRLGAPRVELGGNLKADLPAPRPLHGGWDRLREAWAGLPVLVAGNTVEGEEELLLDVWTALRRSLPGLRLILAPRQPRRFPEAAALLEARGLPFRRASQPWPGEADPWEGADILLLDTLGELAGAYREGTLALVGGGWNWHGGHNPLEAVRWGLPTLVGPGFQNFQDLVDPLREAGLVEVADRGNLGERIRARLEGAPLRPGLSGSPVPFPPSLSGALGRTCELLKAVLPPLR
jgi:3-deoxy-D-manno-octulosonic-acid transferase